MSCSTSLSTRPCYRRQPGEVAVLLDIVDAEPGRKQQYGSRHYFLRSVADKFAGMLQRADLLKLRGFCARRQVLLDTTIEYFTDSCHCVLCPSSAAAAQQLQRDWSSGKLGEVLAACFVTKVALSRLQLRSLQLCSRICPDEMQLVLNEWRDGTMPRLYDMAECSKSRALLSRVRSYQLRELQDASSAGALRRLGDCLADAQLNLTPLLNLLRLLRGGSPTPIRCLGEVKQLLQREQAMMQHSADAKHLTAYLASLEQVGEVLEAAELRLRGPFQQLRVGGENEEQLKRKAHAFRIIAEAKAMLADDAELVQHNEEFSSKISANERRAMSGFVSLLACAVRRLADLDEALDGYFTAGSVMFTQQELAAAAAAGDSSS